MTETPIPLPLSELAQHFPEWVRLDERPGFKGDLVDPAHLLEIARGLKAELGYDLLSSITAADYPAETLQDVVYHFSKSSGGSPLELKCRVARDNPQVPSLVDRSFRARNSRSAKPGICSASALRGIPTCGAS